MGLIQKGILLTFAVASLCVAAMADDSGRLYGKITTVDGDVLEGLIRWDRNESGWIDILNGQKELDRSAHGRKRYSRSTSRIKIFGQSIVTSDNGWYVDAASSGICMGHLKSLIPDGDDAVRLILKSGEEITYESGSTDFGSNIREIIIEDKKEGEIELSWDDIDRVDFLPVPPGVTSSMGERLYGTLTTRSGGTFSGFVEWDTDEELSSDVLEGQERDRSRKIKFDKVASIERYSASGAQINLKTGDDIVLRGSNDVDESIRGVRIHDPAMGEVNVSWDQFEKLEFKPAPFQMSYDKFDGGKRLKGTVTTEEGDTYTGTIKWDDDEEFTWEFLNGDYRDLSFNFEFGQIKSIEKQSSRSTLVTLLDGRTFRITGSNDVDEDNKGIFIKTDAGKEVEVSWDEFSKVVFTK